MNNYFIVIDKRDFKKIKTSLVHGNRYSDQKIWAFSTKDNKVYSKIRKNDLVFFAKEGFESWQFALKVSKKKKDMKFVWDNDFRSKNKNLILFFGEKDYFHGTGPYVEKLSSYRPGIYPLNQKITLEKIEQESGLNEVLRGISERKFVQVAQPRRDRKKVRDLKNYYQHKCQVCLERIEIGKNRYYSEVHHLRPLGSKDKGEDNHRNMIVVCPTHHKAFDWCAIRISLDGKYVIDRNYTKLGKLHLKKDHKLSDENIIYQFYRRLK